MKMRDLWMEWWRYGKECNELSENTILKIFNQMHLHEKVIFGYCMRTFKFD